MADYLQHYLNGEYEQVWAELTALGEDINVEPLYSEALAVGRETMRRVRKNIEILVGRLEELGYQFGVYPDGSEVTWNNGPYSPPIADIEHDIADLERLEGLGRIPLSLKMFWRTVGEVNLIGWHPGWVTYADPLVVFPIEAVLAEHEDWLTSLEEGQIERGSPFGIPIAPDVYHKDNVSGGSPYRILVPNSMMDARLENERNETTFVNYLRVCFQYGGFPGLKWHKGQVPEMITRLADGLLQF